jgi:hypothetical protein
MSLKNPVTPPVIDLGTVRLVTQRLNHYTTPDPISFSRRKKSLSHAAGSISRTELGGFESVSLCTVDCYRKLSFFIVSDSGRYKNRGPKRMKSFSEHCRYYTIVVMRRVLKITKRLLSSSCLCPSIRPFVWKNSAPTGRIFMKFDI